ncbi:MAG: hypothetical protein KDB69_10420, partial [Acidimicrobiia bacterium]|nr:hypothetical protein [Acidimicrobiia bacterium]
MIPRLTRSAVLARTRRSGIDVETLAAAASIVDDIRLRGGAAVHDHAVRLGDLQPGGELVVASDRLIAAVDVVDPEV